MWGALGQLATAGFVIVELFHRRDFTYSTMVSFLIVLGIVVVLLLVYAIQTICRTARLQSAIRIVSPETPAAKQKKEQFIGTLRHEEAQLPEWHLL